MRLRKSVFVILWAVAASSASAHVQQRPDVPLPADPSTVIISMDDVGSGMYSSGIVPPPPGRYLEIRADGRINPQGKGDCGGPYEMAYITADVQA